jgi:hypothetical protein
MPRCGSALAAPAGQPHLAGEGTGEGLPARAEPTVSAADSSGCSAGRPNWPYPIASGRERGPAPSRNSRRFFDAALQTPRLLRGVPCRVGLVAAAILLFLVPSSFAQCARSGSTVSAPAAKGFSAASPAGPTAAEAPLVMSLAMVRCRWRHYDPQTPKGEGNGRSVFRPPFLPDGWGVGRARPCAWGKKSRPDRCQ